MCDSSTVNTLSLLLLVLFFVRTRFLPLQVKLTSRDPSPPPVEYVRGGGGIFKDMAVHDLDMARFLMGSEPLVRFCCLFAFALSMACFLFLSVSSPVRVRCFFLFPHLELHSHFGSGDGSFFAVHI